MATRIVRSQHDPLPVPYEPAFPEGVKEGQYNWTLDHYTRISPALPPCLRTQLAMEDSIFICDVQASGKGFFEIDDDQLPVVPLYVMKRRSPFEWVGSYDLYAGLPQLMPEGGGRAKGAEMVMKDVDAYAVSALFLQDLGQFESCFIIPEDIELQADDLLSRLDRIKDGRKGLFAFMQKRDTGCR